MIIHMVVPLWSTMKLYDNEVHNDAWSKQKEDGVKLHFIQTRGSVDSAFTFMMQSGTHWSSQFQYNVTSLPEIVQWTYRIVTIMSGRMQHVFNLWNYLCPMRESHHNFFLLAHFSEGSKAGYSNARCDTGQR